MALLVGLLLCGPLMLAANARPGAAAVLLLVLAALCHDLPRQPWRGCRLRCEGEQWWWSDGSGRPQRVDTVRSLLSSPLATCVLLRDSASGRCWWLVLFHDSLSRETLSALRRRLVVQG